MALNLPSFANIGQIRAFIGSLFNAVTAGTVAASKGVVVDANKDVTGFRNITMTGAMESVTVSNLTYTVATHDYGAAAADWTLSAAEQKAGYIVVTNASGAVKALLPVVAGKPYWVLNTSGQALTIGKSGGTLVSIASTKSAVIIGNAAGTEYIRMTPDA